MMTQRPSVLLPSWCLFVGLAASGCSGADGSVAGGESPARSSNGSAAGTDSPAGAPLFDTPSGSATRNSLEGVWAGVLEAPASDWRFDSRWRLTATSITFATRCVAPDGTESAIAAVTARARVSTSEIAILESKEDKRTLGDVTCRATARPGTAKRCGDDAFMKSDCFELDGTSLVVYGSSSLEKIELTKISD